MEKHTGWLRTIRLGPGSPAPLLRSVWDLNMSLLLVLVLNAAGVEGRHGLCQRLGRSTAARIRSVEHFGKGNLPGVRWRGGAVAGGGALGCHFRAEGGL